MFIHVDKRNGTVMEITGYRVPGRPNPKQHKVCVGKMDANGVFMPNRFFIERTKVEELQMRIQELEEEVRGTRKENKSIQKEAKELTEVVTSVSGKRKAGLTYALDAISATEGFDTALKHVFGDIVAKQILSLAYYLISSRCGALDDFCYYDLASIHPYGKNISSPESSNILAAIKPEAINNFFKEIREVHPFPAGKDCFCAFDGTAFSSYSKDLSEVEVSHGKQDPDLKHFAMAAVYSSHDGRCAYYRLYRGNIPDVKTIDNFVEVSKGLALHFRRIIIDRGYCSWSNLYKLHQEGKYQVIMCLKANLQVFTDVLAEVQNSFEQDSSHFLLGYDVYGTTVQKTLSLSISISPGEEKKYPLSCHIHVYYNMKRVSEEAPDLYAGVQESISWLTQQVKDKHLSVANASKRLFSCKWKSLITVRRTSNRTCIFDPNSEAINQSYAKLGYFMLLTTEMMTATEALGLYRAKDGVERVFNNVKNDLGFDRAEVKTDATLEGKVFVVMVAGMLSTHVRNCMRKHKDELTRKTTYNNVLKELELIYNFTINGRTNWCEISDKQSLILKSLNVPVPVEAHLIKVKVAKKRGPKPKV